MIQLTDYQKNALKSCKDDLKKANFKQLYKDLERYFYNKTDIGDITAFILENGVDIWKYTDMVYPNMFRGCTALDKVEIPEGITRIGKFAFTNSDISEVEIPNTVKKIDEGAFYDATHIKKMYWPESVVDVGANCFNNDSSVKITTPRRKGNNKLRLPKSEIEWYKRHLTFIDEQGGEE